MACKRHGSICHGHASEPDYERPVLDALELAAVFRAAKDAEERAVFLLGYDLALRCGEVCRVRGIDVDWRRKTIRPPRSKGGKVAELSVAPETLEAIRPFATDGGPIFGAWGGERVRAAFRRVIPRAGLPGRPARDGGKAFSHILRRSRATHMWEAGVSPKAIQRQLGHKSLATTYKYLGLTGEEQGRASTVAADLVRAALRPPTQEGR